MEKIVFSVEFDDKDADKKMKDLVKTSIELKAERQALEKSFKDGSISVEEYTDKIVQNARSTEENAKATKELKKDMDLANAVRKTALGSIEQERIRLTQLTKAYNALSKEERENTQEGQKLAKTIKSVSDSLKAQESAIGNDTRKVGSYTESIKEAVAGNTQFGKSVATVGTAVKTNPIGFLVTALISLVGILKESKPFMDFFEGVMSRINAVVDVAEDRFFTFASGLKEIFSGNFAKGAEILSQSIKGIGDEIAREVKLSGDLSKARQQLERDQINNIARSKELIAEQEKLKTIRDDETNSISQRLAANEKAFNLEKQRREELLSLAQRNLDLIKQEVERRGGVDQVNNEMLTSLREAENQRNEILEESEGRLVEFITNRNSLNKEAGEIAIQLAKEQVARQEAIEEQLLNGSIERLAEHEGTLVELQTNLQSRLSAAAAKGLEDRIKYSEIELAEQQRIADEEVRIQQAKVDSIFALQGSLSDIAGAFIKNAKTAADVQKGIALTQIATDTAMAISSLVRMSQGNPLNLLTAGAAGAAQFVAGLATILTNVAKAKQLLSAKQQFADGGLIQGYGGPKQDNIPVWTSAGEAVMTAKSVQMFGPQLSQMNVAGGGRPFKFAQGFADGGLVSRSVSAPVMQSIDYNRMASAFAAMPPPVLHITELNAKQSQIAKTVSISDI